MARPGLEGVFADWKEREALAEAMIPMIGGLYRRNVVIYIHGLPLYNQSVIELMKAHRFGNHSTTTLATRLLLRFRSKVKTQRQRRC